MAAQVAATAAVEAVVAAQVEEVRAAAVRAEVGGLEEEVMVGVVGVGAVGWAEAVGSEVSRWAPWAAAVLEGAAQAEAARAAAVRVR